LSSCRISFTCSFFDCAVCSVSVILLNSFEIKSRENDKNEYRSAESCTSLMFVPYVK
jgi:hypothetical protein